jgi:hypothetical protein
VAGGDNRTEEAVRMSVIRKRAIEAGHGLRDGFEWRSREPSRLEGFSDAVFAFAVTLLVVSLEVPKTYDELLATMSGFFAFAVSFALLVLIWHGQYVWFRRYALDDKMTVVLTMVLLFVVLFFVYPLKFFAAFSFEWIRAGHFPTTMLANGRVVPMVASGGEFLQLASIYSAGYAATFAIFSLMYWHAWRNRAVLELNDVECVETRYSLIENLMHVGVGLLSVILALVVHSYFAMFAYFLVMPLQFTQGKLRSRARQRLR